jgi:hypothetical protein
MTTPIDQRVTALESELSDFGGKIAPIEAQLAALPAKHAELEDHIEALSKRTLPLEQRTAEVDTKIAALLGAVTALSPPVPPVKRLLVDRVNAWAEPVGKILIPILLLVVAWWIKDSVDAALKAREIEVSTAEAMRDQLTILRSKDQLTQPQADAAALVLATFGRPSIFLIIREYDFGSVEASLAADKALLVLGLTHPSDLCSVLDAVLSDKGGRFRIETHTLAAKHIGQARCEVPKKTILDETRDWRKTLNETRDWLKNLAPGNTAAIHKFREEPTAQAIHDLRTTVDHALDLPQH